MKIKQFERHLEDVIDVLSKASEINRLYASLLPQMESADAHLSKQMGLTRALDYADMERCRVSARLHENPFEVLSALEDELELVKARYRALSAFWAISTPYPKYLFDPEVDKDLRDAFCGLRSLFEFDDSE